jgi:hypothetical protein
MTVSDIYLCINFFPILFQSHNSAYVDWKTFLSRLNIAGPKPGKGEGCVKV